MKSKYTYTYHTGHYTIYKFIMNHNNKGVKVTDLDIEKGTRLGKSTVLIYRTKLMRDGVIARDGSDSRSGRVRKAWKCIKPFKLERSVASKVKVPKINKASNYRKEKVFLGTVLEKVLAELSLNNNLLGQVARLLSVDY